MRFNTFTRKGWGRIYLDDITQVNQVREIIRELDDFEFDYIPKDIFAPFQKYPEVVYIHKFSDLDLDKLTATCWAAGIKIWCFDAHNEEYPST